MPTYLRFLVRAWDTALRPSGYTIPDNDQDPDNNPDSVLGYDTVGRLGTVASNGITHTHGYIPGTGTLANLTTKEGTATILTRTLYHDRMGRIFGIATANAAGVPLSRHGYTLDAAGRRIRATRENAQRWDYGYDDAGQVTSGVKKFPDGAPLPRHTFAYQYDGIGNRTNTTHGGANTAVTYTPDALNQYDEIETERGRFILGEAPLPPPSTNDVFINGGTTSAAREGGLGFYWKQITEISSGPVWSTDTVTSNGITLNGHAWTPAASVVPAYDFNGNLTNDGRWDYLWDAENRLIRMTTTIAAANVGVPRQRLDFVYDSQGRRVSKTVSTSPDGNTWTLASDRRFLYDGWNLIAEYEGSAGVPPALTATYLWGPDLSGTMQGAGGVGGLLAVHIHAPQSSIYYPAYDGNGNITAWISATGTLLARMDYSPFGQLIAHYKFATDAILSRLPFGFSTKYTDPETGLLYYGHRYYDPAHGRWHSRDPIEESGGVNLNGFVGNVPTGRTDRLGHEIVIVRVASSDELGNQKNFNAEIKGYKEILEKADKELDAFIREVSAISDSEWRTDNWKWSFLPGGSTQWVKGTDKKEILEIAKQEKKSRVVAITTGGLDELEKHLAEIVQGAGKYTKVAVSVHADGSTWFPDSSDMVTGDLLKRIGEKMGTVGFGLIACSQRQTGDKEDLAGLAHRNIMFEESLRIMPNVVDWGVDGKPKCGASLKGLGLQRGLTHPKNRGKKPEWEQL